MFDYVSYTISFPADDFLIHPVLILVGLWFCRLSFFPCGFNLECLSVVVVVFRENRNRLTQIMLLKSLLQVCDRDVPFSCEVCREK